MPPRAGKSPSPSPSRANRPGFVRVFLEAGSRPCRWRIPGTGLIIPFISDVTQILEAVQQGDPSAADQLLPLVYGELRKLARAKMANEAGGNTLQPTALVHEAWMRLVGSDNPKFAGRAHFFAAAAEAMRRILIDRARRKRAQRHGGG